MGSFSVWHWLIVLVIVLVLFGRGKIPELMGDVAKGIKSFKKGMSDDDNTPDAEGPTTTTTTSKTVDHKPTEAKEPSRF
jgi:sec-independent protein translocase protein TatA